MVTTFGKLKQSITDASTRLGAVRYLDYGSQLLPSDNWLQPIMHKRQNFEYEKEVRVVRWRQDETDPLLATPDGELPPSGYEMEWDPEAALDSVIVSAHAEEWFYEVVQKIVAQFAPALSNLVIWSDMRADPVY